MAATGSVSGDVATPVATFGTGRPPWVVLLVLTFVYVLNFLDRQLIGILAKPIQDSLQVSDGQLGLIGGLYFAMFYCFIAIPVGWLADRGILVAPGTFYGAAGAEHVRIALTASDERIDAAVARLA